MNRWLLVSIIVTLAAFGASVHVWQFRYEELPALVPTHWNMSGEADGFTPKENIFWVFFMMPTFMAGLIGLTLALPWLSPKNYEVDRFRNVYFYVMALVIVLFGYLHWMILAGALRKDFSMNRFMIGGFFLFFALIGNVMGQVKRNFWMGVRTPWTLASDAVWDQTHRVTAWLWTPLGLLGIAAVLLGAPAEWCFASMMIAALAPVFYSLYLYKRLERQGKL